SAVISHGLARRDRPIAGFPLNAGRGLQLGAALRDGELENGELFGLAMDRELESILEQGLEPAFLQQTIVLVEGRGSLSFRFDIVPVRVHPARASRELKVVYPVRHSNERLQWCSFHSKPWKHLEDGTGLAAHILLDGGDFEGRPRVLRRGAKRKNRGDAGDEQ